MILFICHENLNRSPRAAEVFRRLADQKGFDVEIQSAGINAPSYFSPKILSMAFGVNHVTKLTDEMLEKADVAVALDDWVQQKIETDYGVKPKRIVTLGIPDHYSLIQNNLSKLYKILDEKLEPLAEEISLSQRRRPNKEIL